MAATLLTIQQICDKMNLTKTVVRLMLKKYKAKPTKISNEGFGRSHVQAYSLSDVQAAIKAYPPRSVQKEMKAAEAAKAAKKVARAR